MGKEFNQITTDEIILNCAVRYALGRRTYIVNTVCEEIKKNTKKLSTKALRNIKQDIEKQGENTFLENPYGDKCDKDSWMEVLKLVSEEIKRKE